MNDYKNSRPLMLLTLVIALSCGCASLHGRRLSKSQVTEIARQVGRSHGKKLQDFDTPKLLFVTKSSEWIVAFHPKLQYAYGDTNTYYGFAVHIDDKSGHSTYFDTGQR